MTVVPSSTSILRPSISSVGTGAMYPATPHLSKGRLTRLEFTAYREPTMTQMRSLPLLLVLALLAPATPGAARAPGGGNPATDCYAEFDGVSANRVVCSDGDPSCDSDGAA